MTNKGPAQEAYCLVRETDTYQINTKIIKLNEKSHTNSEEIKTDLKVVTKGIILVPRKNLQFNFKRN